ncbi:helix-turn-helix domain-containing protein [Litchfieldia alkalitelluris]|uniref:helix-turn-helix domain-containing protein n=1 Tax=Litchfieldia alkalitelluris TaxID=304268 RepID=UPI000996A56F|nr:helix-turn-helix transcriptional regulator [Litchfieldia alkalitelluris]
MSKKPEEMYVELGRQIKMARKNKKMTMNDLSQKVDLSQSAISMIENGVRYPSLATLAKFSEVLEHDFSEFISTPTEPLEKSEKVDIEMEMLGFQLVLSLKEFKSDYNDPEINTAVRQTFVAYLQKLFNKEEFSDELKEILKRTIKDTLDKKQSEIDKLYNQINE